MWNHIILLSIRFLSLLLINNSMFLMQYKVILLDLDDTLLDTQKNSQICLKEIYEDYHINMYYKTFEDFSKVYFENNHQVWRKYELGEIDKPTLLRDRFLNPFLQFAEVDLDFIDTMNKDYLSRVVYKNNYIEGAVDLLKYLDSKYQLAILSNGFSEIQYDKIGHADLTSYFDKIILSDEVGINKPHPNIFKFALQQLNIGSKDAIMIGDNINTDILGAFNSGIDQIWFNPKDISNPLDIVPTYTVARLENIKQIL